MNIFNGLLLGLATGIFCTSYCAPVFLPQLMSQRKAWSVFLKFNLGRFFAYVIFGAVFGWLGAQYHAQFLQNFARWVMITLSILLILYGLGLTLPKLRWCAWTKKIQLPLVSGFLLGINICPPFLLAIVNNFQTGGVLNGVYFFIMFFLGTTVYLVPLVFLGYFSKIRWVRQAGRLAAIAVGVIFLIQSI